MTLFGNGAEVAGVYKGVTVYRLDEQQADRAKGMIAKGVAEYNAAAAAKGLTQDSGECTYLFPEIIKQAPLPDSATRVLTTPETGAGWAPSVTFQYEQKRWVAPTTVACCSLPNVQPRQVPPRKISTGLMTLGTSYVSCSLEQYLECGVNGYEYHKLDSDGKYQATAMEALSYTASQVAIFGNSSENIQGILNNPDYPEVRMPAWGATSLSWVHSLLSAVMWLVRANATYSSAEQPRNLTLALSTTQVAMLQAMPLNATTHVSVLDYFLGLAGGGGNMGISEMPRIPLGVRIDMLVVPEFEDIDGCGGANLGMLYETGNFRWIRPTFDTAGNPAPNGGSAYIISPPLRTGFWEESVAMITRVGSVFPVAVNRALKLRFPTLAQTNYGQYSGAWTYGNQ